MNASSIWNTVQVLFVSTGAAIGYFIGGFDGMIRVLLAFVVLDYITALAVAVKEKRLSSDVGFWGIFKKILIFAVIALANLIDNEIVYTGDMLRTATVFFYLANEGLSVLENCAALGLLIPEGMRIALLKIRNNKKEENHISETESNTVVMHVESDQIEDIARLKQIFDILPTDPPVISDTIEYMREELTDGRGADDFQ